MSVLVTFNNENWDGCIRFIDSDINEVVDARPILSGLALGTLKVVQSNMEFENVGDDVIKIPYIKSETWIIERV